MKSSTYESIRIGRFAFGSTVPFYPTGITITITDGNGDCDGLGIIIVIVILFYRVFPFYSTAGYLVTIQLFYTSVNSTPSPPPPPGLTPRHKHFLKIWVNSPEWERRKRPVNAPASGSRPSNTSAAFYWSVNKMVNCSVF